MQHRCPLCNGFYPLELTDRDLPPTNRTEANLWKSRFFEMHKEVVKANKGIRRLRNKILIITQQPKAETGKG